MTLTSKSLWVLLGALSVPLVACGGSGSISGDDETGGDEDTGGGDDTGIAGDDTSGGDTSIGFDIGGDGGSDTSVVDTGPVDTGWDGRIDPDAACAADVYAATKLPPNILLLLDKSGSMGDKPTGSAVTKWVGTQNAIKALLDKSPADMKVGIKFFPYPTTSCDVVQYQTPEVAVAPLSTTKTPIECWLGATTTGCGTIKALNPGNGTPMNPAVDGSLTYMKTKYVGDGARIVILITDGDPNGCGTIDNVITTAAKGPAAPAPPVLVYVIGAPGGTVRNLSRVAFAGGGLRTPTCIPDTTDETKACHYQIGDATFEADLTKALDDISKKALTCTFTVPPAKTGTTPDPSLVNVDVTVGGVTSGLPKDTTHTSGWDYTDGGATITVFGPTCDKIKADATASVQIVVACKAPTPDGGTTDGTSSDTSGTPDGTLPDGGVCVPLGGDCSTGGVCCPPLSCLPNSDGTFSCKSVIH